MARAPYAHSAHPRWAANVLFMAGIALVAWSAFPIASRSWQSPTVLDQATVSTARTKSLDEYTYVGDDYPHYYPIDLGEVSLTPENTIHYQIFSEDAEREWLSIFPDTGGFVRLGRDGRRFGIALFHQMHCLARIRRAMRTRQSSEHVHHCFSYLRQMILCDANPTLEPVIPILGRRSVNAEVPRVCRDWTKVFALAGEQTLEDVTASGAGRD
ncbi:hypothetical protein C8Q79DRAFT_1007367 [Trametes meyenii]|nr:hypothetical protein C8Q79DRAFT_1007367 [Trametes meyenii]